MEMDKLLGSRVGVFHSLVLVLGFQATLFANFSCMSGVFSNLLPYNCSTGNASLQLPAAQGQLSSLSVQYQLCDQALGELTSLFFFLGMTVGSIVVGPTSDLIGRLPTVAIGAAAASAAGLAGNYCPHFWMHLVSRGVCGCGAMMQQCAVQVYGNEVHTRQHRGKFNSAWTAGMAVGGVLAGLISFLTKLHQARALLLQTYMLFCCSFGLSVLLLLCWLPESPLWLLEHGRLDRAVRSFARIAKFDRRTPPTPQSVRQLMSDIGGGEKRTKRSLLRSLRQLDSRDRIRLAVLLPYGFSITLNTYGSYFVVSKVVSNVYVYMIVASVMLLPAAAVMSVGPRQTTLLLCGLASGLLCLCLSAMTFAWPEAPGAAGWASLGLGLCGCFFSGCGYVACVTAGAELFPTGVRNSCMGLLYFVSRVGSLATPLLAFAPLMSLRILALALPPLVASWPALALPDSRQLQLHSCRTIEAGGEEADGRLLRAAQVAADCRDGILRGTEQAADKKTEDTPDLQQFS